MANKKTTTVTAGSRYGNYAEFIQNRLVKLNIDPGDRVHITLKNKDVEGNLLAQSELGDPNSIQIKLDNGYNIGVKVDETFEIKKLSGKVDLEKFQIHMPKQKKKLPKISLIATGGTIASRIDYLTGGVVMAMQPEEIFASLPELFNEISLKKVISLFTMGSEDLTYKEWEQIANKVGEELNDGVKGVVITHGTDTMGFTAAALSFMLRDINAPVVLTGAQRSSDRGSFDGAMNLISAARIAGNADLASVVVCMHESSEDNYCQISRGTKVRKMHTTRRDAFKTINELPMMRISYDGIMEETLDELPRRKNTQVTVKPDFEEKVALIKVYPGINPEIIDFYMDRNYRGFIIEGTGLGHVPTFPNDDKFNFMKALERALDENKFVGMTSQCLHGSVHPYVYRATRTGYKAGITYLGDMLPETAYVKLGWVMGNYPDEEVKEKMLFNFAGEFSRARLYREY